MNKLAARCSANAEPALAFSGICAPRRVGECGGAYSAKRAQIVAVLKTGHASIRVVQRSKQLADQSRARKEAVTARTNTGTLIPSNIE